LAVTALGVVSAATYLNRPVTDRYPAFTFADVALANAAVNNSTDGGPSTLVILDGYDAMDVQFLDAGRVPTIVAPMTRVANVAVYSLIVAPSRADIAAAAGAGIAAEAQWARPIHLATRSSSTSYPRRRFPPCPDRVGHAPRANADLWWDRCCAAMRGRSG